MGLFSRSILQSQTAKAVEWLASGIFSLTGTFASSTLNASTALVSDASNNLISSVTTSTELTYLSGVAAPLKYNVADLLAQTAAVASILSVTAPNDGNKHTYLVGGYITVTAISVNTVTLQVIFTDQNSAVQTLSFFGEGLTTAAVSTVTSIGFPPMTIRAKNNTSITVKTVTVGVGSQTYDTGCFIQQIS